MDIENNIYDLAPKLERIVIRFISSTNSRAEVEDIVQESLITLWELNSKGYEIRNVEALAIKITKNICVAHYRKQRIATIDINDNMLVGDTGTSDSIEEAENEVIIANLFKHLTPTERELVQMRNSEGLSLDEIAEVTGKPKNSIKVTLSKARRKLLARMKELK